MRVDAGFVALSVTGLLTMATCHCKQISVCSQMSFSCCSSRVVPGALQHSTDIILPGELVPALRYIDAGWAGAVSIMTASLRMGTAAGNEACTTCW